MQWLASICVRRPVFASVIVLTILVVGFVGYSRLSVDRFPNVEIPIVAVITTLPGASSEQVETELSDKIEEAINTINGIDELRSVSTEGVSQVIVSFQLEKDINVAAQEVREHVSTVLPDLPEGTKSPVISKLDPDAAPVVFLALESSRPIREVTEYADHEVRQALENVSGVGQVSIVGGRKRQVQVVLDPVQLRSAGLTAVDVQRAIVAQNITTPGGAVDTGPQRLTFRVSGARPQRGGHRGDRRPQRRRAPDSGARRGARRRWSGRGGDRGQHRRQARRRAVGPQAVWRKQRGGRRRHHGARQGPHPHDAGRLQADEDSRQHRDHADQRQRGQGAPHLGGDPRLHRGPHLPGQLAQHDHRRAWRSPPRSSARSC